jgi:hypothetical protein
MTDTAMVRQGNGAMTATQGIDGSRSLAMTGETHALAEQTRAEGAIKAMYTRAMLRPRNEDQVRLDMLKRAKTTAFAKAARYSLPRGGKNVEGWSVRFVEDALAKMGNIWHYPSIVSDTPENVIIHYTMVDLETNTIAEDEVIIAKTIERKSPQGYEIKGQRLNSQGELVYIVYATADDLLMKMNAAKARMRRNTGLQVVPMDLLEELLPIVQKTRLDAAKNDIANDPEGERKRLVDAFAELGVMPVDLAEYLGGRPLDALTPELLVELRLVYQGVKDRAGLWTDYLASSPYRSRAAGEEAPESDSAAGKARQALEQKKGQVIEAERGRRAFLNTCAEIGQATNVHVNSVAAIVKLAQNGKSVADIARYGREQTGIEDETLVGEVVARARKAGLLPPDSLPGKGSEPPVAPPATAPAAEGAQGAPAATRQRKAPAAKDAARRTAIAEQEGVTPETVAAVEELAGGGDDDVAISAALRVKGLPADPPTVAAILSALKK